MSNSPTPGYNDRLDPDRQITAEELIASMIFESQGEEPLSEEKCSELGRSILLAVLQEFRSDLVSSVQQDNGLSAADVCQQLADYLNTPGVFNCVGLGEMITKHSSFVSHAILLLKKSGYPIRGED